MKKSFAMIWLFIFAMISCGLSEIPPEPVLAGNNQDFTIIVMPDTQGYVQYNSRKEIFRAQTNWIIEHQQQENIIFVIHLGDIIQSYSVPGTSEPEWEFAADCMNDLAEAGIPFGTVPGNHDYYSARDSAMYNQYFPLSGFEAMETFGGAFEENSSDNTWHSFRAGGISFLVFMLEFGSRDVVLEWAGNIIEDHPGFAAISATHGYLDYDDHQLGPSDYHSPVNGFGLTDGNSGTGMWDKHFSKHKDNFMVLSGHTGSSDDGAGYLESENDAGELVYQLMSNYQYFPTDNLGYLRIMDFSPRDRNVTIRTYSPHLDLSLTDSGNNFTIEDIRFFK